MIKTLNLITIIAAVLAPLSGLVSAADNLDLRLSSKGWFQFGQVMHSSDTSHASYNYHKNWLQSPGAQFTVLAGIGDHWEGAMGLGGFQTQTIQGRTDQARSTSIGYHQYVTQARFTYRTGSPQSHGFRLTFGMFPFNYNRDVKNLGLYLLRGPVYPGFLFGEFESKQIDTTVANTVGIHLHASHGGAFTHDLIIKSETDLPPIFDFSLAYLASLNLGGVLELGGGVNFYRLIPMKKELTAKTNYKATDVVRDYRKQKRGGHPYEGWYKWVDTTKSIDTVITDSMGVALSGAFVDSALAAGENYKSLNRLAKGEVLYLGDTTFMSHQGVKLMARFAFDPKPLLGALRLSPPDLRLYGEIAVIGTKNFTGVYENISERIPIMLGFNLPTFGLLDVCAFEVQWYGAKFRNDYKDLELYTSPIPKSNEDYGRKEDSQGRLTSDTTIAFSDVDVQNMTRDNWKWSLYLSKTIKQYLVLSLQVANDHYRPAEYVAGYSRASIDRYEEACTTIKDFYTMFKIGYQF